MHVFQCVQFIIASPYVFPFEQYCTMEIFSPSRDRYQYETSNIMQAQRYGSYIYL